MLQIAPAPFKYDDWAGVFCGLNCYNINMFDEKIKITFDLFNGKRTHEEDQKIFDKVSALVFDETLAVLEDNMADEALEALDEELRRLVVKPEEKRLELAMKLIVKKVKDIPDIEFIIKTHINSYIDQILIDILNKKYGK